MFWSARHFYFCSYYQSKKSEIFGILEIEIKSYFVPIFMNARRNRTVSYIFWKQTIFLCLSHLATPPKTPSEQMILRMEAPVSRFLRIIHFYILLYFSVFSRWYFERKAFAFDFPPLPYFPEHQNDDKIQSLRGRKYIEQQPLLVIGYFSSIFM